MSPSVPSDSDPSLPSLSDMTSTDNEKHNVVTPTASGTASSVSSDLSTASQGEAAANVASDDEQRWYYYLSPHAARRLPHYQYDGADTSHLYKYVLAPFATWCVEKFTPTWIAPNTITLVGLGWMILSYCVIWFWCPGLYEANTDLGAATPGYSVPGAIFLLNGCAMLIYQTLDNMDGRQARRTGSSSPLGLLFDHGCDAMNLILGSGNWIAAMAMVPGNVGDLLGSDDHGNIQSRSLLSEFFGGDATLAALLILCPMVAFFVATWEQYYTGKLILPPFNGPSEGLVMGACLSFASFLWGPMYWQTTSLADGVVARAGLESLEGRVRNMDLIVLASVVGLAQEVALKMTFTVRNHGRRTLRSLVPQLLLVTFVFAMVHFDPTVFLRRPRTMMHLISGLFTEQTIQLMLDHMVGEKFQINRWCLLPAVAMSVLMVMGVSLAAESTDAILEIYTSGLWVYLAFKTRVQLWEICDVLGIWCFDIVTPHPKKLSDVGGDNIVEISVPVVDGTTKKTN